MKAAFYAAFLRCGVLLGEKDFRWRGGCGCSYDEYCRTSCADGREKRGVVQIVGRADVVGGIKKPAGNG